jgi:hypothetical protein
MDNRRINGAGSGAVKYDILTALAVAGLNGNTRDQLSMARLTTLITARYNWRTDELSMGQREMAALWGVGERTVKREVKRWLDTGLLRCRRSGVRGRVAAYRLNLHRVCELTEPFWHLVGTDFCERMQRLTPGGDRVIRLDAVRTTLTSGGDATGWECVRRQLADLFPTQFEAWLAPLVARDDGTRLVLEAKSAFAAEYVKTHFGRDIIDAVAAEWSEPREIVLRGPVAYASRP